ncbi:MAG: thioredoxin-disulfide reductase [Candidatus Micrarchaeota archaeon]
MGDYDVIIIGGGPAGLTAGIYCSRKKLKNAIITVDTGGQTNLTNHIENYPGTGALPGPDLMEKFKSEAEKFGAKIIYSQVKKAEKTNDGNFNVIASDGKTYSSRALILCFGSLPKMLGVPREDKFLGRGVSTCTTCDAPLFKNKITAVVGGGNSAVEGALELSTIASKVYLIHRRKEFRADPITIEKLKQKGNVELILDAVVEEIAGEKNVKSVKLKMKDGKAREIPIDGLFIEIGYEVKTDIVRELVKINEKNEIIIDANNRTSVPGVFAAGDVTTVAFKQTVISAGEGAKAALECYKYLTGGKIDSVDWT